MDKAGTFEVTIKQEGEVITVIKTDCIIAAISDLEKNGTAGILMTQCNSETMLKALKVINEVEKQAIKQNPLLLLAKLGELAEAAEDKEESSDFSKFMTDVLKK